MHLQRLAAPEDPQSGQLLLRPQIQQTESGANPRSDATLSCHKSIFGRRASQNEHPRQDGPLPPGLQLWPDLCPRKLSPCGAQRVERGRQTHCWIWLIWTSWAGSLYYEMDLIEKTIRSQNAWSLLSCQLIEGYIGSKIEFPSWPDKNSRKNKMDRPLQELSTTYDT